MPISRVFKNIFKTRKQKQFEDAQQKWEDKFLQLADDVKKMNRWSRRQSHFLESMHQDLSSKLDATYRKVNAPVPYEPIRDFAQNFSLYCLTRQAQDSTITQLWSNFVTMLKAFDMELILDLHAPFDDSKHQTCDVRYDPEYPDGTILEVVRPGLFIQGRLQQQALVVVNKAPEQTTDTQYHHSFQ